MEKTVISIDHVSKSYDGGKTFSVSDLSLEVRDGEIFGILGPNGAGKSTTLNMLVGVLAPTRGTIKIDGIDVAKDPVEAKRRLCFVGDTPDHLLRLRGREYLRFIADIYGVGKREREERIRRYADVFGLTADLAQPLSEYSHGMKQKLAIISALLHEPKLILMDEPFVGLDPTAAYQLKTIMREHCDRGGAIFFSTHVLEVAEKLCDKVAIIKGGRLIASGTMEEVKGDQSLEDVFLELEGEGNV